MKEHYDLDISPSYVRKVTLSYASSVSEEIDNYLPENQSKDSTWLVGQVDGTMIPIVETNDNSKDKRKDKILSYKEARLSLSYRNGDVDPFYRATFEDVDHVGEQLLWCTKKAGYSHHLDRQKFC